MGKITMTVDGNTAAAYAAYAFTEVASIYPITPSSTMAEVVDEWAANGRKNIFGQTVKVAQLQSEAGAAGSFHGSLQAGALTTTFTASQGLLLMIPNMYKCAGELLPGVFHVSARSLAAQALNIFGDHQDVMAVRQTGCVMLASGSVQEVIDLALVAHLAAVKGRLPFVHFFDGFRTSHEVQKVEALSYEDLAGLIDKKALQEFRDRSLSPNHPVTRGTAQNPDIYFQTREACNPFYEKIVPIVEEYMGKISALTGRSYNLFSYYGAEDAKYVIVAMGSVCGTIEETIDYLNAQGEKYGLVKVHLFRPFSIKHFCAAVPDTAERIAVLERTKEPGAPGEPLYLDVRNSFYGKPDAPMIIGGRFGLGSKDTTPADIKAVFDHLKCSLPKTGFTVGIEDDVTHTSLPVPEKLVTAKAGTVRCKFWGLGSDGTVGANKQAVKIIGEHTDQYVQAYFAYDSKKSGGLTTSHLRFGSHPIKSAYLIDEADYIACHNQSFVHSYDLLKGLKRGGTFVLNCLWEADRMEEYLPKKMLHDIAEHEIEFYCINAVKIAEEIGLGNRINMIMQGAFFSLADVLPKDQAKQYLKEAVKKAYGKKGDKVIQMNHEAIEHGFTDLVKIDVPAHWKDFKEESIWEESGGADIEEPKFVAKIMRPMNRQEGDQLPVSAFSGIEDGTFPCGTSAYEKRGIAVNVPEWNEQTCIQCNQCSFICPHACVRPFLLTEEEKAAAPKSFKTQQAKGKGMEKYYFRIQISTMDCTGCGNCADVCPAKPKALVMKKLGTQSAAEVPNWKYALGRVSHKGSLFTGQTVKESQFRQPLIEFSGACAGCGEPAYIKLITQLFGERMMIANATGCSSIWGASAPTTAYTCTRDGRGPSWANSLFEDNAEYGYGMYLGVQQIRDGLRQNMEELIQAGIDQPFQEAFEQWIQVYEDGEESVKAAAKIRELLDDPLPEQSQISRSPEKMQRLKEIQNRQDYLVKRSVWMIGGDGWAYDIGYGGLDHVLASGEDVNVLVFDTEIYSNTGGQASKSTPAAAVAKFAASGKKCAKKDLGRMMMTYHNVYVAQIAMGADKNQTLKAVKEAESYHGPSIIIAYAPCISHGLRCGMGKSMDNMAQAVAAGYWHLYRYHPDRLKEGKNPFTLDSKDPTGDFQEFLMGQVRYSALERQFPDQARKLFEKAGEDAKVRLEEYKALNEASAP